MLVDAMAKCRTGYIPGTSQKCLHFREFAWRKGYAVMARI